MPILKLEPEWLLGNTPEVKNGELGKGYIGNLQTVEIMKKVARLRSRHPIIRELALRILEIYGIVSQDYFSEAKAIGEYVRRKVRYVRDIKGVETLHDPLTLIDQLTRDEAQGDCDDMSLLVATLLLSIGHQPYFCIVKYNVLAPSFNHIYVCVYEKNYGKPRTRLSIDSIMKRRPIGFEVPSKIKREIKV